MVKMMKLNNWPFNLFLHVWLCSSFFFLISVSHFNLQPLLKIAIVHCLPLSLSKFMMNAAFLSLQLLNYSSRTADTKFNALSHCGCSHFKCQPNPWILSLEQVKKRRNISCSVFTTASFSFSPSAFAISFTSHSTLTVHPEKERGQR